MWLGIFETILCVGLMAYIVDYAVISGLVIVIALVFVAQWLAITTGQKVVIQT
jgi:hypothetical protein